MYHNNFFTDEQWECIRVCVANAPIPYDITKKKIPAEILAKIGQPTRIKEEGIPIVKYDLTPYGICLLYTSPSPRDLSTSRMPSSA